ncbi:hypothetical protein LCGC14_0522730 [marine sediment metagenome]|uniref:Uncharacterized protein n=1 Tax=marine sediment metagenome TaxID=412755 RepID=A0A0F9UJF8_9ZZZZ
MAAVKKQVGFDLAKLAKLPGPFRLYLTRQLPGGQKEPIPLPQTEWSNQEVIDFENTVVTRISGGGNYAAQLTTLDGGDGFTWEFGYSEKLYPSMVPPGLQSAYVPPPVTVQGAPVATPAPIPYGLQIQNQNQPLAQPQAHFATPISQLSGPAYMYPPGYGQPIPQYPYPSPYQPPRQAADSKEDALKKELEQIRLANQQAEHRRERESDAARHTAQMTSLREEIRRASEAVKQPAGESPELVALKSQNAMLQKQIEAQAQAQRDMMTKIERQQAESRDQTARDVAQRQHEERMRQMEENSRREMQGLKDQMALVQANNGKQDPMLPFLMESQRQAADVAREQARTAASAPQQLMSIVEGVRRSSGADQIMTNLAGAYDSVNNMVMRNAEMMGNFMAQSQGSPVMGLIGDALHSGKEVLAQMVTAKSKSEEARAQADAARDQQTAAIEYARANAAAAAAAQSKGNGVPEEDQVIQATEARQEAEVEAEQANQEVANLEPKLFGSLLWPEIEKLRQWIAKEGIENVDPRGIVVMLIQAAGKMKENGLDAPVLYLFENQQWAELFDRVIPDVTAEFASECVKIMSEISTRLATVTKPEEIEEILRGPSKTPEQTAN